MHALIHQNRQYHLTKLRIQKHMARSLSKDPPSGVRKTVRAGSLLRNKAGAPEVEREQRLVLPQLEERVPDEF